MIILFKAHKCKIRLETWYLQNAQNPNIDLNETKKMLLMWEKSHCCAFPILHKHDVNTSLRAVMQQHHTLP